MPETILCSRCQKSTFTQRVDLNSTDMHLKNLSEADPFALDTQTVNEMILLCDMDQEDYQAEIAHLQSRIRFIQEQQTRLRVCKARLRSLTCPVRKLPNEILTSIFDYICEWNVLQVPSHELTSPIITYLPALSLSSTCTRWRSVAKSSPCLWSRIKLEITSSKATTLNAFIATINLFLERSGQYPLSLSLVISGRPQEQSPLVLELLMRHCHRWRTFQYISGWRISYFLKYEPTRHFAILESLDICSSGYNDPMELNIFRNASQLREIVIHGLEPQSSHIDLPFSQFTNIDINACGKVDDILHRCPNIISLQLRDSYDSYDPWWSIFLPHITLNAVEAITVVQDRHSLCAETLTSFTFPTLHELRLLGNPDHELHKKEKWPQLFNAFLSRSSCRITTLVISAVMTSDADLVSVLQLLPTLVTFEISDHTIPRSSPITSNFISSLNGSAQSTPITSSHTPLIPKLRYLVFDFGGTNFDDMAFVDMISSRSRFPRAPFAETEEGVDCLRSVVMRFRAREVDLTVYTPLQILDRIGLRVVVRDMNGTII
ncbi:hypothetical protein BT96DRAFT_876021 [Gymnopus androsaceus JB14]|uniref:F-box domain-containing protein n=1 Tax=Gymnopus androsaceus JB14 TaxID=1447944 RepID=A0A6A4I6L9_9AGAR|nr:hypothetical protein BT96DRAFT_876021 [Gymnopus androsaceus JB14]